MNRMRIGGIAAGMFVVGLLTGLGSTAVARDNPVDANCAAAMSEHMSGQDMTGMTSMMGGSMMGGSMMGPDMMSPDMMGQGAAALPNAPTMPGALHEQHHPQAAE